MLLKRYTSKWVISGLHFILARRHDRKAPNHTQWANHRCYCRYAAESSSASKGQSQQGACLAKIEPRATRHERLRVTIADVAEKIRFHMSSGFLLAGTRRNVRRTKPLFQGQERRRTSRAGVNRTASEDSLVRWAVLHHAEVPFAFPRQ